jgi:hypothetical protein
MAKIELREYTVNQDALLPRVVSGGAQNPSGGSQGMAEASIDIPYWGTVPAGALTETGERSRARITVRLSQIKGSAAKLRHLSVEQAAFSMYGDENLFALQIRGESMVEAGIEDGALILFRRATDASPGQVAVVMVDGEATLKRVFVKGVKTELRPCNESMASIWVETDRLRIKGVMVGRIEKAA